MNAFLRKSGATVAAALLASSCAAGLPSAPTGAIHAPAGPSQGIPGSVTVPVTLPAIPEQAVQYAYDRNYINTVEVRLYDSLGNESVQVIARNAYLATSRASGTINVVFHNVMPGTFTLTVRTSHVPLLAAPGRVSYDSLADVFFADVDSSHGFNPGEKEYRLVSKSGSTVANSNFLVFAQDTEFTDWAFPDSLRQDVSTVSAGFGLGAATQSIVAGATASVAVTVGQVPSWGQAVPLTSREVTAGESITLSVADAAHLQAADVLRVAHEGVSFARGIVDFADPLQTAYVPTVDTDADTVTFTPTRSTNASANAAPSAWPIWLARGQAAAEVGLTPNGGGTNAPRVIVQPALVNQAQSRIFGAAHHLAPSAVSALQIDLRDTYRNPVAGNVTGVNEVPLASLRRANAGVELDYAVVTHSYPTDPRNGRNPFILPGRTTGTVSTGGVYTQGATAPELISRAATYSVTLADASTPSDLRIQRLEIPYYIYAANTGSFGGGSHIYVLNMEADPVDGSRTWISLQRQGGPTIASASVTAAVIGSGTARTISLPLNNPAPGTLPLPLTPTQAPVILSVPARSIDPVTEHGTLLTVSDYGARRVSDSDTVRARVLNNVVSLFTSDVTFQWLQ